MTVVVAVGTRFPAHATSSVRILLAGLPTDELDTFLARTVLTPLTGHTITDPGRQREVLSTVHTQSFALVDQKLEEGLRSAAAPVRDRSGDVVAAINLSASAGRTSPAQLEREYVPPLPAAATQIECDLHYSSRP